MSVNTNLDNINDDMLVKYLLGEATAEEQRQVAAWIAASGDNKRYFDHFSLIWDQSKKLAAKSTADTDAAWQRFVARTEADAAQEQQPARRIALHQRTWARVAAVLVLCSALALTLYNKSNRIEDRLVTSGQTTITETLPDGSVAVLNKNSSIAYKSRFEGNERHVTLTGEAFFTVTPDKHKPFVIDANNVAVTVVGTSFNVKTSAAKTEVIVETGIVQVAKKQRSVRVLPYQKATVTSDRDEPVTESNQDELYNYYRTHEFVCNNTPLSKLVPVLNEAYNAHIVISSDKTGSLPLTVTIKDEPLDQVLHLITETLKISAERRGNEIVLK